MNVSAVVSSLLLASSIAVSAQQPKPEPRRPKLAAGADTNDARAYYDFAIGKLTDDAERAADALYWATRIEPTFAEAYNARRVALIIANPARARAYSSGDQKAIAETRSIDSLLYRALTLDPFVDRRLDKRLFDFLLDETARRATRTSGNSQAVRDRLNRITQYWPPAARAWLAYGDGADVLALLFLNQAVSGDTTNATFRIDRAHVFVALNQLDSALADLTKALTLIRTAEQHDRVFVYQSRALVEHSVGVLHLRMGNTQAARDAFARALQEDLSYYPAHMQLAYMALKARDTTAALAELNLATELRSDDPGAQYLEGYILVLAGHSQDAERHLKAAMELDPVYAAPKLLHARILESADFREEASAAYRDFLSVAARNDPNRALAETRLTALRSP